jgi:hypothetical protein
MLLTLALALQVQVAAPPPEGGRVERRARPAVLQQRVAPVRSTTPASGDTVGYWQQRLRYTIVATLDETPGVLHAIGTLVYVNQSPDTLHDFYVHQHLNAFRPGSKWSATDEREGRVRFQRLRDPDYAYERFTSVPTCDGVSTVVDYPGAPDSTIAHFRLPRALAPGDSVTVALGWDARPSTVPRRQARRGRSFDFAQWFPKPAVYDRGGWEPHALVPAGELYGEYGDYDVTMIVRADQVIGSTGVPVSGDPGWGGALRSGVMRDGRLAYGSSGTPDAASVAVPSGYKAVRFVARDVHHFGWSTSPDYRYEGGVYVRATPATGSRAASWDTVSIHALYRKGDEAEWGGGQAVERTRRALAWLESRYGPYAYPQMTVLHRIEGGGTEFPMLQMNGSASQGLILHEGGHVFSYGILGNNEWRSGWMDEGLTEYQTEWAQGFTRPERAAQAEPLALVLGVRPTPPREPARPRGYAARAVRPSAFDETPLDQYALDLRGRSAPVGLQGEQFRDFGTYNQMIYTRAAMMYGALRDVMGDSAFTRFLHTYYSRWALRHVDEAAMRSSAEAASGRDLGWFFDQWVHRTGLIDYEVTGARITRRPQGWVTLAHVRRVGDYRHPMPVGVRTASGWTMARADALLDVQDVRIETAEKPVEVAIDPTHLTEDWYRPNDSWAPRRFASRAYVPTKSVIDWPLLDQASGDAVVVAYRPLVWASEPNGALFGVRVRSNYQGLVDEYEVGYVNGARNAAATPSGPWYLPRDGSAQWWLSGRNPRAFGHVLYGASFGVWNLDGVSKVQVAKSWDRSPFTYAVGVHETTEVAFTGTSVYSRALVDPTRWSGHGTGEASARWARHTPGDASLGLSASAALGVSAGNDAYARVEASASRLASLRGGRLVSFARLYAGGTQGAPIERQIFASVADPASTFENHLWRPRGGILSTSPQIDGVEHRTFADGHYRPTGGAALRGYASNVVLGRGVALNAEQAVRVFALPGAFTGLAVYASLFGDAAVGDTRLVRPTGQLIDAPATLADAGASVSVRGRLYDREVRVRGDVPVYVRGRLGVADHPDDRASRFRIAFAFEDLW